MDKDPSARTSLRGLHDEEFRVHTRRVHARTRRTQTRACFIAARCLVANRSALKSAIKRGRFESPRRDGGPGRVGPASRINYTT
ncbi:hypothetical protein PUN28_005106 [Cardiocondyla obscurior]|uniref:Uncharacterized protein n=1 Tax=Cardiocondyla obscurior TaxID=286306 RepID=A0AAW2GK50_9HYME